MWVAPTGVPTSPRGSTPIPMDQIASVHVISVDAGRCAVPAKPLIWPGGEPKLLTGRVTCRRAGNRGPGKPDADMYALTTMWAGHALAASAFYIRKAVSSHVQQTS